MKIVELRSRCVAIPLNALLRSNTGVHPAMARPERLLTRARPVGRDADDVAPTHELTRDRGRHRAGRVAELHRPVDVEADEDAEFGVGLGVGGRHAVERTRGSPGSSDASGNTGIAPPRPNSAAFSSASTAECIGPTGATLAMVGVMLVSS